MSFTLCALFKHNMGTEGMDKQTTRKQVWKSQNQGHISLHFVPNYIFTLVLKRFSITWRLEFFFTVYSIEDRPENARRKAILLSVTGSKIKISVKEFLFGTWKPIFSDMHRLPYLSEAS